jgi:hypothetical protein
LSAYQNLCLSVGDARGKVKEELKSQNLQMKFGSVDTQRRRDAATFVAVELKCSRECKQPPLRSIHHRCSVISVGTALSMLSTSFAGSLYNARRVLQDKLTPSQQQAIERRKERVALEKNKLKQELKADNPVRSTFRRVWLDAVRF